MNITIHLPDELDDLFREWATREGRTVEAHALDVLLRYCEDQEDIDAFDAAEREDDGTRIPMEQVMRESGFEWDETGMVRDAEPAKAKDEAA